MIGWENIVIVWERMFVWTPGGGVHQYTMECFRMMAFIQSIMFCHKVSHAYTPNAQAALTKHASGTNRRPVPRLPVSTKPM